MAYSVSALGTLNPLMKRTGISYLAFAICCFLTLSLTACGQRGPLYLPETEKQVEKAETKAAAEESVDNDAEESDEETPRA
jgi:predicted small lipoprotein YifL